MGLVLVSINYARDIGLVEMLLGLAALGHNSRLSCPGPQEASSVAVTDPGSCNVTDPLPALFSSVLSRYLQHRYETPDKEATCVKV